MATLLQRCNTPTLWAGVQADQLCCDAHEEALLRLQMTHPHTFTSTHWGQQQTREAETVTAAVTVSTDQQPSHAVRIF